MGFSVSRYETKKFKGLKAVAPAFTPKSRPCFLSRSRVQTSIDNEERIFYPLDKGSSTTSEDAEMQPVHEPIPLVLATGFFSKGYWPTSPLIHLTNKLLLG